MEAVTDEVTCVRRGADTVTLEVAPAILRTPPWKVEKLNGYSWFGDPCWAPLADVQCDVAQAKDAVEDTPTLYHIVIPHLRPETQYTFRVIQEFSALAHTQIQCSCCTASRPPVIDAPHCTERRPDSLAMVWSVPSMDAPALECHLQYRQADSVFSRWHELAVPQEVGHRDAGTWQAHLPGLVGATDYLVRVRARNCIGVARDFSTGVVARTSDRPPVPDNVRLIARQPHSVVVVFTVEDVEGAPVLGIYVELAGALQWHQAKHQIIDLADSHSASKVRSGKIVVEGLIAEVDSNIRLWSFNAVGRSLTPTAPVVVRPSDRPRAIDKFRCIGRWPNVIEIEWNTKDPEGAPVKQCVIEVGEDKLLGSWVQIDNSAIRRVECQKTGRGKWQARIEGLVPEETYLLRSFALNDVGRSPECIPLGCRTADRPLAPLAMKCVACTLKSVTIEFDVECDQLQSQCIEPVTNVAVECAGALVWQQIPASDVTRVDPCLERKPPAENIIRKAVIVNNLLPGTWYTLRIWVANAVGWNIELPPPIDCHTATRPEAPSQLNIIAASAHSLNVAWHVGDPEGAPVLGAEVQIRENSVFAAWREPSGAETIKHHAESESPTTKPSRWERTADGLRPELQHICRVRARNAVDWSDWSEEVSCQTAIPPGRAAYARSFFDYIGASDNPEERKPRMVVECSYNDPIGAPVSMCVVLARKSGQQVLARRFGETVWRAYLTGELAEETKLSWRAANSVGWSAYVETSATSLQNTLVTENKARPALVESTVDRFAICNLVSVTVISELSRRREIHSKLQLLHQEASSRNDAKFEKSLTERIDTWSLSLTTLEALSCLDGVGSLECASWATRCRDCQKLLPLSTTGNECNVSGALTAIQVILEAGIWLERLSLERLDPLWLSISNHVEVYPQSARVFQVWAQQSKAWSERFRRQTYDVWLEAFATSQRLLAAIGSNGNLLVASERLPQDLNSLMALREAIDQQIQKLTRVYELLGSVESAGSETKSFDQVSVSDKVAQSVLGVLFSAVLPFPGTIEVGVASISMLWLESDLAGRHLAVEHQKSGGADGPHRRFDQRPKFQSLKMLQSWIEGGHDEVALVHNATARVLTVRLVNGEVSLMQTAYKKIQDAHPFMNLVTKTVERGINAVAGDGVELPVLVVEPTDVAIVPLPAEAFVAEGADGRVFDLDFAYGMDRSVGRSIGRVRAKPGNLVSFICLDRELHINNSEDLCLEASSASSVAQAEPESRRRDSRNSGNVESTTREELCTLEVNESAPSVDASSGLQPTSDTHPCTHGALDDSTLVETKICTSSESNGERSSELAIQPQEVAVEKLASEHPKDESDNASSCLETKMLSSTEDRGCETSSAETRASTGDEDQSTQPLDSTTKNEDAKHEWEASSSKHEWDVPLSRSSRSSSEADGTRHGRRASEDSKVGGTIEVVNRDFKPITLNFYRQAAMVGHMFDHALKIAKVAPGENQILHVPLPGLADGGDRNSSSSDTHASPTVDAPFEVEVVSSTGKSLCSARWGQIITYEGCL